MILKNLSTNTQCQKKPFGWMYGRGTNKEGGVGVFWQQQQPGLTLRGTAAAVVKNDVGPATVAGKEGIARTNEPKSAHQDGQNTVHAAYDKNLMM